MIEGTPDTSNRAIGERLVAVREARGLSQSSIARMLEMSPQRYGNYERGRSAPPADVLLRFWQITGATSDYILFNRMDGMPFELVKALQAGASASGGRGQEPKARA